MNRFGGFSRALLSRKTTSVRVKLMSTDITKKAVEPHVVELTAEEIERDRVDNLSPMDLWEYKERYGL